MPQPACCNLASGQDLPALHRQAQPDDRKAHLFLLPLCSAVARGKKPRFLVSSKCHPQTIAVCQTRADGLGLKVCVGLG